MARGRSTDDAPPLDRVVTLAAKVADLRRELAACEAELASLLRAAPAKRANSRGSAAHDGRADDGRGMMAKIVRLLSAHPRDVYDAAEVSEHLGANIASVRVMLKRLLEAKKIRRTGRGAYRAR